MRALKWLLGLLALIAIAIAAVGHFALPSSWRVERVAVIQAPPSSVYPYLAQLQRWPEWSPFLRMDPTLITSFEGPDVGIGQTQRWTSKRMGNGKMTITGLEQDRRIYLDLELSTVLRTKLVVTLEPIGDATRVTWLSEGDAGDNPYARYLSVIADRYLGRDYEAALAALKQKVENAPPPTPQPDAGLEADAGSAETVDAGVPPDAGTKQPKPKRKRPRRRAPPADSPSEFPAESEEAW